MPVVEECRVPSASCIHVVRESRGTCTPLRVAVMIVCNYDGDSAVGGMTYGMPSPMMVNSCHTYGVHELGAEGGVKTHHLQ